MPTSKRLWLILLACVVGAFLILGGLGIEVYRQAPPMPKQVVTASGRVLYTEKVARLEHDARARSHSALRCLWLAINRAHAHDGALAYRGTPLA